VAAAVVVIFGPIAGFLAGTKRPGP